MKKIICMFLTLLLLVCIVGCSQAKDSDNHVVQDYSEEYEVVSIISIIVLWVYCGAYMVLLDLSALLL